MRTGRSSRRRSASSGATFPGQSLTFAPSVPEFVREARRVQAAHAFRGGPKPARPPEAPPPTLQERARVGFKVSVLCAGLRRHEIEQVVEANRRELDAMVELARRWGLPIPLELLGPGGDT